MQTDPLPKVSICIPTYEQTFYLNLLLQSIAKQTFEDYEIIISDDSVSGEVKKLVDSFPFGKSLKYFKNPVSLGSPANWNAAMQKARGRYIKIMHHDDAFTDETALSTMISLMEANNYDFIFCNTLVKNVRDPAKNRVHKIRKLRRTIRKPHLLFFGNSIGAPSTLAIRREKFTDLRFDEKYIWLVDIEYYIRLFHVSSRGSYIPKPFILTHVAMKDQVTAMVLEDYELQIKEQAMLYNFLSPVTAVAGFFMQVSIVRLLFKARTKNRSLMAFYSHTPKLVQIYFSSLKIKSVYFAYYFLIRSFDLLRKIIFY